MNYLIKSYNGLRKEEIFSLFLSLFSSLFLSLSLYFFKLLSGNIKQIELDFAFHFIYYMLVWSNRFLRKRIIRKRMIYIKPDDSLFSLIDQYLVTLLSRILYGISRFDVATKNYFRSKRRVRRYLPRHRSRYVLLERVKSLPIIFPVTPFVHASRVPYSSRVISHCAHCNR